MQNAEENLNTESNDIAGNRIDGPVGNTAAQHNGGPGIGQPGTDAAAPAGTPNVENPAAPTSSESLAASETSVGQGAVDGETEPQENKEANPDDLKPTDTYGGNFSNSTQGSYRDQDRRDNQDSDPSRGEFGAHGQQGATHGGFGNQNRLADYEPHNTAEDRYYGGPGAPGEQTNSYREYDGRDERPDARTEYGFEAGTTVSLDPSSKTTDTNDNGSPKGTDSGYAQDYGHTSLRAMQGVGPQSNTTGTDRRNQNEDYMPAPASPSNTTAGTANPETGGQRPAAGSQGYGDRGRDQANEAPDFGTGNERNGYVQPNANKGDAAQGTGSRGGSYNDAYDDSQPNSRTGSPARGEERSEDRNHNYGSSARTENRSAEGDDNAADHGAPRRNAGRDGEADE
ncbi:hypothetical protein [Hymenobacter negativus]|nr:hypothetical protein [Hymenobacter negativus]